MERQAGAGVIRRAGDRRVALTLALVVIVGVAEIVFGIGAYAGARRHVNLAIALACAGVAAFAIIDLFVRPRGQEPGAGRLRRFAPHWAMLPFLCALASSAWVHYQQWQLGLRDLRDVAIALDGPSLRAGDGPVVPRPIETQLGELLGRPSFRDLAGASEKEHFIALARVVGRDLEREHRNPDRVRRRALRDTLMNFCLTLGMQAVFVLWIPALLVLSIHRARHALAQRADEDAQGAAPPATRCVRASLDLRDRRILADERPLFVPRLCFAILLVLGTTYVFAPFGLRASYIMALVHEHALPGQTSFALWCTNFASVPVIVVGFVGFLIYALITATQRFAQNDLDDQAVFSLLVRGLAVILLSFALSASPLNDEAARIFVFIAGVFPVRALEAIAKRANVTIDPDFVSDGPGSFEGIVSLDPTKVFALRAAGIHSTHDLAATPIEEISERVRIDPRLLGRAVDRAILIDAVGCDLATALEPFAITSATELVDARPIPQTITDKLGDGAQRAAERLSQDRRVAQVAQWLAGAQG